MIYNQGDTIKLPNNSMKLFTALLIHDVKHDFGSERLWDPINVLPVCDIAKKWNASGGSVKNKLYSGGTIDKMNVERTLRTPEITTKMDIERTLGTPEKRKTLAKSYLKSILINDSYDDKLFKENYYKNVILKYGLYNEELCKELYTNTGIEFSDKTKIIFENFAESVNDITKYLYNSYLDKKDKEDKEYKEKNILILSQKLDINYISFIIKQTNPALDNILINKAVYHTFIIYNNLNVLQLTPNELNNILLFFDEAKKTISEDLSQSDNLIFLIINTLILLLDDKSKNELQEVFVKNIEQLMKLVNDNDDDESRTKKRKMSGGMPPKRSRDESLSKQPRRSPRSPLATNFFDPGDFRNVDQIRSEIAIKAHLNKQEQLKLTTLEDKSKTGEILDKLVSLGNLEDAIKGKKTFLLITNTILGSLVNILYDYLNKLKLKNNSEYTNIEEQNIDTAAESILQLYIDQHLYKKIDMNSQTISNGGIDKKLFANVVMNYFLPDLYHLHTSDDKINDQNIFHDDNNKAYIINNAAISAGSKDRVMDYPNNFQRILCPISSIIDPAPPYLGGCNYDSNKEEYVETGKTNVKMESNFENGYIYYNAYQKPSGIYIITGYKLYIGILSNKTKLDTLPNNSVNSDYLYLTNEDEQLFKGSPTGLSVRETYSRLANKIGSHTNLKNILAPQSTNITLKYELLSIILLKSLGDMLQEFNGILKYGGYENQIIAKPTIEPWNIQGDALRCVLSNDQPSAARIIIYKKIFPQEFLNQKGYGGFCNYHQADGKTNKNYVIFPYSEKKSDASSSTDPPAKKLKIAKGITRKFIKKPKSLLKLSRKKNPIKKLRDILRQKKSRIKSQKKEKKNKRDKQEKSIVEHITKNKLNETKAKRKLEKQIKLSQKTKIKLKN